MAELDNWFAQKAYKAATFYDEVQDLRVGDHLYLKTLVIDYPHASIVPTALFDLITVYRKLGYAEDIKDKCAYMQRDWSATPEFGKACPEFKSAAVEKPAGS